MLPTPGDPRGLGWDGMAPPPLLEGNAVTSISNPSGTRAMVSTSRLVKRLPAFNPVHEARAGSALPGLEGRGGHRPKSRGGAGEIWAHDGARKGLRAGAAQAP